MTEAAAALFVAHVLAVHLSVPEGARLEIGMTCPPGFDGCVSAQVSRTRGGPWLILYDTDRFQHSPDRVIRFILAHELCHAAYDWETNTAALPPLEHKRHERRADECAADIVSRHAGCRR